MYKSILIAVMTYKADLMVHQEHNQEAEISILRSTLGETHKVRISDQRSNSNTMSVKFYRIQ